MLSQAEQWPGLKAVQGEDKPELNLELADISNPQDELLLGQKEKPSHKECLHKKYNALRVKNEDMSNRRIQEKLAMTT